jgi:hypothetical protein
VNSSISSKSIPQAIMRSTQIQQPNMDTQQLHVQVIYRDFSEFGDVGNQVFLCKGGARVARVAVHDDIADSSPVLSMATRLVI